MEESLANAVDETPLTDAIDRGRVVRLIEFFLVGVVGSATNFAVFVHAIDLTSYLIAGTVAFFVGMTVSFNGNRIITFDNPSGSVPHQYARYFAVSLLGFAAYLATLWLAVNLGGVPIPVGGGVAVIAAGLLNFVGSVEFAFDIEPGEYV